MALEEKNVPITALLLDPNNYRFQDAKDYVSAARGRFAEASVQNRASARLRDEGLAELKNSIMQNGFLPFERIVVRPFDDDYYLVVEGNRRVAALKWIVQDYDAGVEIDPELVAVLDALPVIAVPDAPESDALALSLMGVRHVGGVRQWGGYQRAKLVTELRDDFDQDTGDVAARLGMTAHEVNRRYRAYKALLQMMEDEEYEDVAEPDMYSLFHEAVSSTTVKEWLGWSNETLRFTNAEALRQFYSLITPGSSEEGGVNRPAKISSYQGVRELREILPVPEARRQLLDPDATMADALALAKADDLARSWATQVAEAVAALKSVGALELRRLPEEELSSIKDLALLAQELLATHALLTGASGNS